VRTISTDLATHLATRGAIPLALCADVRWSDDTALYFTSWDRDLTIPVEGGDDPLDAPVYVAGLGMSVSKVQGNSDGKVDSLEVRVLFGRSEVTQADLLAGRWRGASISLFLVNPEDVSMGRVTFHSGSQGQTTTERGQVTAEFLGRMQRYLSTIGETVTSTCQNDFCGPIDARGRGCGLDIADFTYTGTVTDYDDAATISGLPAVIVYSDDLDGQADGFFDEGVITFDDEPWIAFGVRLFRQTEGACVLKQKPPFAVTAGMTFTISRGCSKEFGTCTGTYSNGDRFRAFPHLKGNDKLFQAGQQ